MSCYRSAAPRRRVGKRIWSLPLKVHVPCGQSTKNRFRNLAAELEVTEAELGLALLQFAALDRATAKRALSEYQMREASFAGIPFDERARLIDDAFGEVG
jgi:hypothetical protein